MPKTKDQDLEKVTLNLHRGDMARMRELYPLIGSSAAIREVVRKHLQEIEARLPPIDSVQINAPAI